MRTQTVVLTGILAITLVPFAWASNPPLEFEGPAQTSGTSEATGAWITIFFDDGAATAIGQQEGTTPLTNTTFVDVEANGTFLPSLDYAAPSPIQQADGTIGAYKIVFGKGYGSLVLHAHALQVNLEDSDGEIQVKTNEMNLRSFAPQEVRSSNPHWSLDLRGPQSVFSVTKQNGTSFSYQILANQIDFIQWFGGQVSCTDSSTECPTGGGRESSVIQLPQGQIERTKYSYVSGYPTTNGSISSTGRAHAVLMGGPSIDLAINGSIRLPNVEGNLGCPTCPNPSGKTVQAKGSIFLGQLSPTEDGHLRGSFSAAVTSVKFDEQSIDPALLAGGAIVAAVAGGVLVALLKFLLWPLFTRLTKEQALEHPRRKAIFEYIQHHPGANFREIARNTSIAAGTVRHHLNVLERSGQVVEHNHGSTVRLFENHGKFADNWAEVVLLREPALGVLHEWLKSNPGSPQKAVLEAMEGHGWSRSTTQHRLSRLVEGGLASIRLQGRLKIYSLVEKPQRKGLLPGFKGPVLPAPTP
jgi:predicted transcriptional regulator